MNILNSILIASGVSLIIQWILGKTLFKPKIIKVQDEGWLPIETLPDENVVRSSKIILTDGEIVDFTWGVTYNKYGQIVFGYENKVATHWRKLPFPPGEK